VCPKVQITKSHDWKWGSYDGRSHDWKWRPVDGRRLEMGASGRRRLEKGPVDVEDWKWRPVDDRRLEMGPVDGRSRDWKWGSVDGEDWK